MSAIFKEKEYGSEIKPELQNLYGLEPLARLHQNHPGCRYCYVYRQDEMYGAAGASSICRKTGNFDYPIKRKRDGSYKLQSGKIVFTCFTSDFLLKDADEWRAECWRMMKQRSDCLFYFFTKRIDRFMQCIPDDWGDGYDNVLVGCTVEDQRRADYRLPIFLNAAD